MNELTMKRYDENTTTGVIDVVDEDEEKGGKTGTEEEQEVAPRKKLVSATAKEPKKRGRKQAESTSQTKLTKFLNQIKTNVKKSYFSSCNRDPKNCTILR